MTNKLSLSYSVSSATLVAINYSISAATVVADDKQNHHAAVVAAVATDNPLKDVSVKQDDITSALDNAEREDRLFTPKSSTAAMKPDVGILSKEFSTKGREQPIDKQFAIHRKERAVAADVDVGILSNGRRQQKAFDANLHAEAENRVTGRTLQSEEERLPYMCPGKDGYPGATAYIGNLFKKTDGYFPKCSCPSPTTCGPALCECLELDADGDILQCMDPLKQLCEGTMNIDGVPGPWSMEKCLGYKSFAILYCTMLPCFVDGGSFYECTCNGFVNFCTEYRDAGYGWCAKSKCCQAQTDDEGRKACLYGGRHENYYEEVTSFSKSDEEMISQFNKCSFNSDSDKSIVECYCESFSYGQCVNDGVAQPDLCEANFCCDGQSEDGARLDCFSRFRIDWWTGSGLSQNRDTIQESCVANGRSSDQCKCDIQGLTNCVYGIYREPSCDLFQCCQSQTGDDDEGKKDCLAQDEAQLRYGECRKSGVSLNYGDSAGLNYGDSMESCYCYKSNTLCSSGHSDDLHCELSNCCQKQSDDAGRKECIGNFTTSQPSSAPSETTPVEDSIDEVEASPTGASALPSTSSASVRTPLGAKYNAKTTSKMLTVAAVVGWLLFS